MDRIAVLSDIHGNMPALEAALDDIRQRGVTRILCLGDLVGKGPDSARAVDLCRDVCDAVVRGNWDDGILAESDHPTLQWHQRQLGPERLAYLANLPPTIEFIMSGRRVRLFHASAQGIYHRVHMNDTPDNHLAMFDNTPFTGDSFVPDVVGYGDIHTAYLQTFQQRILFNVGSVGNPLDLTQASYVVMEGSYGSHAARPFGLQFVRVPYDI